MIINIECLIDACDTLSIPYRFIDKNHNFVAIGSEPYYFSNCSTPLNTEQVSTICKDKEFSYELLHEVVHTPKTKGYFDIQREDFKEYREFITLPEIVQDILKSFTLPCIVKRNGGSKCNNVFVCNTPDDVTNSVTKIFDHNSKDYDFVVLAQDYINPRKELRVIILNKKIVLIYDWSNNFEIIESDNSLFVQIEKFIKPIFTKLDLKWAGLDIIIDNRGDLHLIELNSRPGFENFVKEKGKEKIIKIYEEMLKLITSPTFDYKSCTPFSKGD